MRKIVMTGLAAAAAVLGSVIPAASAGAATGPAPAAAVHLASPAQGGAGISVYLTTLGDRISCASPTACLAVGTDSASSGTIQVPVAEALHGTAWKPVAVKAPKGATSTALTGVSCKAATYCLVVGEFGDKAGNTHPVAWTWNGTALTPMVAPPMPGGTSLANLTAVSCVAVKSCVAIGSAYGGTSTVQIIWTWDGKAWARHTATAGAKGTQTQVTAAHCFSLTSCVVIGTADTASGTSVTYNLLIATWNGKALTAQQPGAVTLNFGLPTDVWCSSPSHCAMTGIDIGTGSTATMSGFAEVWNGKTWTATKWAGPKGSTIAALYGVSCTSATSCIAVGGAGKEKAIHAAALSFNGTKWSVLKVPGVGTGLSSDFEGVSCPKTAACVAIGNYGKASAANGTPLAGYWNGSAWKLKAA